ncbi:MAG: biotin--[acetyl-CoA-carboxylase] ligase [Rickettsiaceae bacterium]|tara:strand:+ start:408 stop:1394 length:987 start_codon:yes stop_codon:yes gene_type:complete
MDNLNIEILEILLKNMPSYVSGSVLAKTLKMSRVSIWKRMEKLQKQGILFHAVKNRGYRISEVPKSIHPDFLSAHIRLKKRQCPLFFYEEIDSTNLEAQRKLADGCSAPSLVIAKKQSAGRGRLGRQWAASDEGNLYMTFACRPNQAPERMQLFTLWGAVSICSFLNELHPGFKIKWPNDIIFEGKKLSGILTEAQIEADQMSSLVFGLGLNVNSDSKLWPEVVRNRATCLAEVAGKTFDINSLASSIIVLIFDAYESFIKNDFKDKFHTLWKELDALFDQKVTVVQGEKKSWDGVAKGIDDTGSLVVALSDGSVQRFQAGDVTLAKK